MDKDEEYKSPEMVTDITPSAEDGDSIDNIYNSSAFDTDSDKPLIPLGSDEILISTINLNIDLDAQEEQMLVFRERSNPDGFIHIAIADFDNVQNSYSRVWNGRTKAENIRSFIVYLDDIIGDHNSEIVCSGRDSDGNTTLDIFWKNTTERNQPVYLPVFNIAERGTIEINQLERSRGYHQGLKNGISYTITVTSEADENELIVSRYYWDFPLKKYLLLSQERIENTVVAENQLEELFTGDELAFYDFIEGPWYDDDKIIYFDPVNKASTFYLDDIQENYSWINSYKVLSNLLYVRCRNEIINYIENEFYIKILDLNEINVTVRDIDSQTRTKGSNDIWTGNYTRMSADMQEETVLDLDRVIDYTSLPELSGQYISGSGDIIEFYGSDFYMKNSFEEITGGFAVYKADINILSLKILDDRGIVIEERSYALGYTEEQKEMSIERTLVLTPGALSIYGFRPFDSEFLRLTQTETLEINNDNIE